MEKLEKLKEYVRIEWEKRSHSMNPYTSMIRGEENVNHLLRVLCAWFNISPTIEFTFSLLVYQ